MDMTSFESTVLRSLTTLEAGQAATNEHLGRLNSKVATHEERIGHILIEQAKRENNCPLVDKLRSDMGDLTVRVTQDEAAETALGKWKDRLAPLVYMVAGVGLYLVLMHGTELLKAMK